jgi:hypothetical protein
VQGALNPGAIVIAEVADAGDHIVDVLFAGFFGVEDYLPLGITGFWRAAEIQDYLQQIAVIILFTQWLADVGWENIEKSVQVVSDYFLQKSLQNVLYLL